MARLFLAIACLVLASGSVQAVQDGSDGDLATPPEPGVDHDAGASPRDGGALAHAFVCAHRPEVSAAWCKHAAVSVGPGAWTSDHHLFFAAPIMEVEIGSAGMTHGSYEVDEALVVLGFKVSIDNAGSGEDTDTMWETETGGSVGDTSGDPSARGPYHHSTIEAADRSVTIDIDREGPQVDTDDDP